MASAEKNKTPVDEKELEYFIQECGHILKVANENQKMTAKEILNIMCTQIAQYKKLDHDDWFSLEIILFLMTKWFNKTFERFTLQNLSWFLLERIESNQIESVGFY